MYSMAARDNRDSNLAISLLGSWLVFLTVLQRILQYLSLEASSPLFLWIM